MPDFHKYMYWFQIQEEVEIRNHCKRTVEWYQKKNLVEVYKC